MPIINFSIDSDEDQREQLAEIAKQLTWLMSGKVDSVNLREIAGFLVDLTELLHESGLVGMSAADPDNPDAVRFWAGSADKDTAPYRVLQNGNLLATAAFITGLITGSTIIGSEIKTSETGYPRVEFSSTDKAFKVYKDAGSYVLIDTDITGDPGFRFVSPLVDMLISMAASSFLLQSFMGSIQIQAFDDLLLKAFGQVKFESWTKIYSENDLQTLQTVINNLQSQINGKATGSGISGSFSTADGKVVAFNNGVITQML